MEELLSRYAEDAGLSLSAPQLRQLADYGRLIEKWNRVVNLVGAGSSDAIVRTHIGDCLMAIPYIDGPRLADIGSGAGLPGLVLAIVRPAFSITLVESRQRKCRFLRQAVIELGLTNTSVVAARVEQWRPDRLPDAAVCRGYGSLAKYFDNCAPLHHPGLRLYAMKGAPDEAELAAVPVPRERIRVRDLRVPGWDHRSLVTIVVGRPAGV